MKRQKDRETKRQRSKASSFLFTFTLSLCLFVSLSLFSCDAPHNNPLDPDNPDNHYKYLEGSVMTLTLPYQPIAGVSVYWPEQLLSTFSDSAGNFRLETINPGDGWLYLHHLNYCEDSVFISWQNRRRISIQRFLNAIPEIDSLQIYSIILNRYPNLQNEQIALRVRITDPDNDIDTVLALNNFSASRHVLAFNLDDKWYEKTLTLYDQHINTTEEIIGHPFEIIVVDKFNRKILTGAGEVQRVMRAEVIFISPSGNEPTAAQPVLHWQKYQAGYLYTQQLQVFTAEIIPQLVWEKINLAAATDSCAVDQTLPAGEYFWVIWAIDEFGNRTRSKPASFRVE